MASYTYDVWGNVLSSTGALAKTNPYLYRGYRWDDAVGMYYLNARYYSPETMRFISLDPAGSSVNLYTYADDNPVNEVDPSGELGLLLALGSYEGADVALDWTPIGWGLAIGGAIVIVGIAAVNYYYARGGKKAADSSKAERHGDSGRADSKSQKQIKELEQQLKRATSKERERISQKIRHIRQIAQKKSHGETHHMRGRG